MPSRKPHPAMDKKLAATGGSICGMHAIDFFRALIRGRGEGPECLAVVLVAQLESSDGPINVAISWPKDEGDPTQDLMDAAAVAREAGDVFEAQARGEEPDHG